MQPILSKKILFIEDLPGTFKYVESSLLSDGIEVWSRPHSFEDVNSRLEAKEVSALMVDLDLELNDRKSIAFQTVQQIIKWRSDYPSLSIVVYSGRVGFNAQYVHVFIKNYISYLIKEEIEDEDGSKLRAAIKHVLTGGLIYSPRVTETLKNEGLDTSASDLTDRMWKASALVAQGKSNAEIGKAMGIKAGVAAEHVASVMDRLNVPSRAAIATWYTEQRLNGNVPDFISQWLREYQEENP